MDRSRTSKGDRKLDDRTNAETHSSSDRWLTQLEAAALLNCSARTLFNYRKRGVIPAHAWIQLRGKGSLVRYRRSAIMALQNGGAA